jgi:very-short-patch-repair endonuclease
MNDLLKEFEQSGISLLKFCKDKSLPYHKIYKAFKKLSPQCVSRKNNGRTTGCGKIKISPSEVFEMCVNGLTLREVGEKLGVDKSAISQFLKKNGYDVKSLGQSRFWTDERREHFRKLCNEGKVGVFRQGNKWKYHTTSIEREFMRVADEMNIEYKRQYNIIKGGHQYDFYLPNYNLIVEMDGVYFHSMEHQATKDREQEEVATEQGYKLIRITDVELKNNKNIISERLNLLLDK